MEREEKINGGSEAAEAVADQQLTSHLECSGRTDDATAADANESPEPESSDRRKEILKALESVERDSGAIAESFSSLFASLRETLSEATSSTVDHMNCFSNAAGRVQECVLDASTKGNRFINSCLRLNEEMKGMDALATQLYPSISFIPLVSFIFFMVWFAPSNVFSSISLMKHQKNPQKAC